MCGLGKRKGSLCFRGSNFKAAAWFGLSENKTKLRDKKENMINKKLREERTAAHKTGGCMKLFT